MKYSVSIYSNQILVFALVMSLSSVGVANVRQAAKIRQANKYIKTGTLTKAEKLYRAIPNDKHVAFNKGYLYAQSNDREKSGQYYQMVIQNETSSNKEKAKAYYNMGNNRFRQGEFKEAITSYRQGLLLDPDNVRLKYNLELANNAKKVAPEPEKQQGKDRDQQQQNQERDPSKQSQKQVTKKEKTPAQKNAENILDAFKQQELEDMRRDLRKEERQTHVEKDW